MTKLSTNSGLINFSSIFELKTNFGNISEPEKNGTTTNNYRVEYPLKSYF